MYSLFVAAFWFSKHTLTSSAQWWIKACCHHPRNKISQKSVIIINCLVNSSVKAITSRSRQELHSLCGFNAKKQSCGIQIFLNYSISSTFWNINGEIIKKLFVAGNLTEPFRSAWLPGWRVGGAWEFLATRLWKQSTPNWKCIPIAGDENWTCDNSCPGINFTCRRPEIRVHDSRRS